MTRKHALIAILLVMVLDGALDATYAARGESQPLAWSVPVTLFINFMCFLWYRIDSDELNYPRSRWLNMTMIILSPVGIPYYLLRSRPRGQKLRALLRLAGFAALMLLSDALGQVLSGHALDELAD